MPGHLLRNFQLAAILEVRRDTGRSEAVATDPRRDVGSDGAALDHRLDIPLRQRIAAGQLALAHRGKEGSAWLGGQIRRHEPFIEELFEVVVAGELVHPAAFFVEPHPATAFLDVRDREGRSVRTCRLNREA
ncbi:MAG TPA: hypothetical protein VMR62_25160 [Bryobacteraceae bacterium]|jgi:hypothetical protein|nr:hypothetical protein [Bryobacteraceae bacterium]